MWNGNDNAKVYSGKMAPKTQISVSKMPGRHEDGKHARDQSLDLFSPGAHPALHPSSSPQRHCTPCPADPHPPHTNRSPHTPRPHTKTPTTRSPHITKHISTHTAVAAHTYYHVFNGHKHPEAYTDAHGHSQSQCREPLLTYTFSVGAEQLRWRRSHRCTKCII